MFRRSPDLPAALRASPLAEILPPRELEALSRISTEIRLPHGRRIMEEGGVGRECMLVLEGSLDVERDGVLLGQIGPGDFVGEMALLNGTPRSATVTVREPAIVYTFSRREFASVLAELPTLAAHARDVAHDRAGAAAA